MSKLNIESYIPIQYERACILSQSDAELTSNIIPKGHESSNVKVQTKVRSVS